MVTASINLVPVNSPLLISTRLDDCAKKSLSWSPLLRSSQWKLWANQTADFAANSDASWHCLMLTTQCWLSEIVTKEDDQRSFSWELFFQLLVVASKWSDFLAQLCLLVLSIICKEVQVPGASMMLVHSHCWTMRLCMHMSLMFGLFIWSIPIRWYCFYVAHSGLWELQSRIFSVEKKKSHGDYTFYAHLRMLIWSM